MFHNRLNTLPSTALETAFRPSIRGVFGCCEQVGGEMANSNPTAAIANSPLQIPAWAIPIYEAAFLTARMQVRNQRVLQGALAGTYCN